MQSSVRAKSNIDVLINNAGYELAGRSESNSHHEETRAQFGTKFL